ncbi:MAG: hypothetical protein KA783_01915 [Chitinophagales bacterium]|nr:hypothetical protein [Chitinophagales bacterium]
MKQLENRYHTALRGTDKRDVLNAGRIYSALRKDGNLTLYDEQAITNDLSSMNVHLEVNNTIIVHLKVKCNNSMVGDIIFGVISG